MAEGRPSATAEGAAMLRAAHQLIDVPWILDDPLALPIIGADYQAWLVENIERYRARSALRASVALRSRYAEDGLTEAVERGVRQYVVLGAGLDTFAYRNPHAHDGLKVFEVDHPATQSWKRRRLAQTGIPLPASLTFAPVDFEKETLSAGLARAGFRTDRPAYFSMLGVVIYLTKPAATETFKSVASQRAGSEIVFSYSVLTSMLTEAQRAAREKSEREVAALGEPWLTYFDPDVLAGDLRALGFSATYDLTSEEANKRYFSGRSDGLRVSNSGRLMKATV
jgi:methyltransferase (TIGR00027 family)